LALIPLGTANVLAHDLGIPKDPARAAEAALDAVALRVSVGHVACCSLDGAPISRYFLSVAGVGLDGYLFHQLGQLSPGGKKTLGLATYFLQAFQVWWSYPMRRFAVTIVVAPQEMEHIPHLVTQLLAVRLGDFGNVLRKLAPGASLVGNDFRAVLFGTSSRWSYLLYVLRCALGAGYLVAGVESRDATSLRCSAVIPGWPIYLEADGELLGRLPAELSILPDALTLLVPRDFATRQR
jgi:diacylglycerol kinase (ATP)